MFNIRVNKILLLGIIMIVFKILFEILRSSNACLQGIFPVTFAGKAAVAVGADPQGKIDIASLDLFFKVINRGRLETVCFNFVYYSGKVFDSFIDAFILAGGGVDGLVKGNT